MQKITFKNGASWNNFIVLQIISLDSLRRTKEPKIRKLIFLRCIKIAQTSDRVAGLIASQVNPI